MEVLLEDFLSDLYSRRAQVQIHEPSDLSRHRVEVSVAIAGVRECVKPFQLPSGEVWIEVLQFPEVCHHLVEGVAAMDVFRWVGHLLLA